VQYLDSLGIFSGRTLAAHGVWVDDADLAILKSRAVGVAHCPSSNMKLASGIAPVTRMLDRGVAVGLGTDGAAGSNNDLNLFEEMDLAAKLQKVTTGDPRALPAVAALEMATIRGAAALGLEREIGSIEPGKRADLISVRLSEPHAVPLYDVYSHLVYALKGADVDDVMVNGRLLVRARRALSLDPASIRARAEEFRRNIANSIRAH
jgi:5-methylthioadenosine/S-adenosylhomocysteine deaminase